MRLTLPVSNLRDILDALKPAVSSRQTLPILACCRLTATDCLKASATTLDLWIDSADGADVRERGACCVNYKRLSDAASVLPLDGAVELVHAANALTLTCGRAVLKFPTLDAKEWPEPPEAGFSAPLAFTHHRHFAKLVPFCSTDPTRGELQGIYLDEGNIVAGNGRVLVAMEYPHRLSCIVPAATALAAAEMAESVSLRHSADLIQFADDHTTVTSKLLAGQFPGWQVIVPKENKTRVTCDREALLSACRRALVVQDEAKYDSLRLCFSPGELRVSLSQAQTGDAADAIDCDATGPLEIGFAPNVLLPVLRAFASEKITLHLHNSISPLLVQQDGVTAVALPNRVKPPETK